MRTVAREAILPPHRRSGMGTTDWHELEERCVARRVAAALEELVRTRDVKGHIIKAPPRTLAELRLAFHDHVKERNIVEIDNDLT
jgi:protein required for attachment to host cells